MFVHKVGAQGALIAPPSRSAMWAFLGNAAYAKNLNENKNYLTDANCGGRLVCVVDCACLKFVITIVSDVK